MLPSTTTAQTTKWGSMTSAYPPMIATPSTPTAEGWTESQM